MMNKTKILIIEDDEKIVRFMQAMLSANEYETVSAGTGARAASILRSLCADLIILDLGLPDVDGVDLIRSIRCWTSIPIIVVSARANESDKVTALDAGADDYLTKPFGSNELLARIRTALRHSSAADGGKTSDTGVFHSGGLLIDYNRHRVLVNGSDIHLTQNEYKIVSLLGLYAGKVLTYDFILQRVWGPEAADSNQVLRVHMANIRRKMDQNPADPQYIYTEVGVGYRMRDPD